MKEAGTTHWLSPNTGATNSSGFSALPGGFRYIDGSFYCIGLNGYWWSASEIDASHAWDRGLTSDNEYLIRSSDYESCGFSVRLLRD